MPTTIDFSQAPNGNFSALSEDGFKITSMTNAPDSFVGGLTAGDLGSGLYVFIKYTTDTATLESETGKAFGVSSLNLDGFRWTGFDGQGQPIPGSSQVTINFIGYKNDGTTVTSAFQTDASSGFQNVVLPSSFAGGLLAFQWYADNGSGLALVDNIVIQENRAPTGVNFSGSGKADAIFTGQLAGSDPDGQTISFEAVGDLPAGVTLDPDGKFYIEPLEADLSLLVGQTRLLSFQYRVYDGEAYSSTQTASFTLQGIVPGGKKILGDNRNNALNGDSGSDCIWGLNGNDTINAGRGDDWVDGGKGNDVLNGGDGRDTLIGGDGKDTLEGGAGDDKLYGGDGNDTFVVGYGKDVIFDFKSGHWQCDDRCRDGRHNHDHDDGHGRDRDRDRDNDGRWFGDDHDDNWWGRYDHDRNRNNARDSWDRNDRRDDDDHHGSSGIGNLFDWLFGNSSSSYGWGRGGSGWGNSGGGRDDDCEWVGGDLIRISPNVVSTYADLMAHGEQKWFGTVFTFDNGSSLTLMGVRKSSLDADDFLFG